MKFNFTNIVIIALVAVVVIIPAGLYVSEYLGDKTPSITDYCNTNGFREVYPCTDGSFQAIREVYTEGFRIVKPDGTGFECPFTLPQYQVGECREYTTAGTCGYTGNICEDNNACVSDLDCPGECLNWTCS